MKAKSIMIIVLAVLLAGMGVGGYFLLKKNKPKDPMVGVSAINTITAEQNELDKVAVKLVDSKNAVLVANNEVYNGTYTKTNKTTAEITCVVEEATHTFKYVLEDESKYIEETTVARSEEILSEKVELKETKDYVFDTGLWKGVARYTTEGFLGPEYELSSEGSYTFNLDHKNIYTADGCYLAWIMKLNVIGDMITYSTYYMNGEPTEYSDLFFVEKAGEHDPELDALREGGFGDLIYTCEYEGGTEPSRYYDEKAKEEDYEFDLTENTTLKAKEITKNDTDGKHHDTVDTQLTLKTDGTVKFVQTSESGKNFDVTGKWYNLGTGLLIVLNQKADYFGTFFGIQINGADYSGKTLEDLKEEGYSMLDYGDDLYYDVYWTDINNDGQGGW